MRKPEGAGGASGATLLEMLIALAILAAASLVVARALAGLLSAEQAAQLAGEAGWVVQAASASRLYDEEARPDQFEVDLGREWRIERMASEGGRQGEDRWVLRHELGERSAGTMVFGWPE